MRGLLGVGVAVVSTGFGTMRCDNVLRSHQPQGSVCSAGLNNNLIPRRPGLELAVALRAREAVF